MKENEKYDYALRFQRGEEAGFTYFFKPLYRPLLYYAFRILNDKSEAEDIVGESFVRIWERHENFNHPHAIKSWLYKTVHNGCLSYLKKEKNNQKHMAPMIRQKAGDHENFILNDIIRAELSEELYKCIEDLPRACKKVFQMLYIQGKTAREIAEELGVSISTIKNHKARGLILFRERFPDLSVLIILCYLNAF